jgi:exopolysaccharide biosynthesis polyprenyl glycosylphosphotransferase
MVLDLVALNFGLFFMVALRPEHGLDLRIFVQHPHWFLILSVLWLLMAHVFDCYDLARAGKLRSSLVATAKAGAITCGIYLFIPFITPTLPSSRLNLVLFFLFTLTFVAALRGLYILAFSQPFFRRKALVVGTGWEALAIAKAIKDYGSQVYQIVGFVSVGNPEGRKGGQASGQNALSEITQTGENRENKEIEKSKPVMGGMSELPRLIGDHQATTLILAYPGEMNGKLPGVLTECIELGVEIVPMPVLYEKLTGRVPIEHVGSQWRVTMPLQNPGDRLLWAATKRLMDIVLVSLGFVCLAVAMPFIAAAIYIDSPGPIFFTQRRVGKGGRIFKAYKFRSMRPRAENDGPVWAARNDPRATRVGRLLRKTHVDEFPQFWNILKGEMSVVGPRSERPEFVQELAREIPFYKVRHAVRPGMAGWGLVKQGYGGSKEEAVLKLQYDLYYIKHQSLWLDTVILLKTIIDTLTFRGR